MHDYECLHLHVKDRAAYEVLDSLTQTMGPNSSTDQAFVTISLQTLQLSMNIHFKLGWGKLERGIIPPGFQDTSIFSI